MSADDDKPRTPSSLRTVAISRVALAMLAPLHARFREHLEVHGIHLEPQRLQDLARIAVGFAHDAIVEERRAIESQRCPYCGGPRPPQPIAQTTEDP